KWEDLVKTMKAAHSPGWKRAGIHDAILNSTHKIPQNKSLIFWSAEKWSPKTNTFILPWGEITITLEDMMVLGGFSVSGDPVTSHSGTFELAIFLARGRKMALAPAVLATLYKDLHLLQNAILDLQQGKKEVLQQVFSPMHHIQVWVLERFPRIRPDGMCNIRDDETRLARWPSQLIKVLITPPLESGTCEEHFVWRPYVKDTKHITARTIYKEDARVEKIDKEEMDSFARCVRVSKLVWLDISQQYFPHRVSKQCGYNQDIPADVLHLESNEDAWADYATSMENEYIYLPSRQLEGHMTVRLISFLDLMKNDKLVYENWNILSKRFEDMLKWFYLVYLRQDVLEPLAPIIGRVKIDLLGLYKMVDSVGGYLSVSLGNKWKDVAMIHGLPVEHDEDLNECYKRTIDLVKCYYETTLRAWYKEGLV
nr:hypothetical protein [Tanacetum cinerariifolium]